MIYQAQMFVSVDVCEGVHIHYRRPQLQAQMDLTACVFYIV